MAAGNLGDIAAVVVEARKAGDSSDVLTILPDGSVDYEERFGATLNAELDLRRFPFDRQALDIELQSFTWDRSELGFATNEPQTGFDADFETPEWSVSGVRGLILLVGGEGRTEECGRRTG